MKRLKRLGVFAAVCAVAATPFALMRHADAAAPVNTAHTTYNDFVKYPTTLDSPFDGAKLFYTKDTNIIVKDVGDSHDPGGEYNAGTTYKITDANQQVVFLVTGSTAHDYDGSPVDVIIRADNLRKWDDIPDTYEQFGSVVIGSELCGIADSDESQDAPTTEDCTANKIKNLDSQENAPIIIVTTVGYSDFDISYEFIKAGSFNDTTKKGTPAGINSVSFVALDMDVVGADWLRGKSDLDGHEGVYRLNPQDKTDFYYFLNHSEDEDSKYHMTATAEGLAVDKQNYSSNFDGIHYGTTVLGTATNLSNSKYTLRYSAGGAGIKIYLGSPSAYETKAPKKYFADSGKTDCTKDDFMACLDRDVAEGDTFNYIIRQTTPSNYSNEFDSTVYRSLYKKYANLKVDHNYSKFQIRDTLDPETIVAGVDKIKIYDENDTDVTYMFDLILENNFFMASAKRDTLSSVDFYGHTYRVVIPASIKAGAEDKLVLNAATTIYKYDYDEDATADRSVTSNSTLAFAAAKKSEKVVVTTKYTDKKGKKIAETVTKEYAKGSKYSTAAAKKVPKGYQLSKVPKNSTGIANADVTVTYVYELINSPDTIDNGPLTAILIFSGFGAAAAFFTFRLARRR